MLMYDGDQLIYLMHWTSVHVSSILFLHDNGKLPYAASKTKNINWLLENFGNLFHCRSNEKCVVKYLKP